MRRALIALLAAAACISCTGDEPTAAPALSTGPTCVEPVTSPSGPPEAAPPSAGTAAPPSAGTAAPPLVDLALACLGGGGEVRLARLGRPAVINLWASWCTPCRKELPAFESYARAAPAGLLVVGVATGTGRSAAGSIVEDLVLTFPTLLDPDRRLLVGVGRLNLPVTLFVDRHGRLSYVYNSTALDRAGIEALVAAHLGLR